MTAFKLLLLQRSDLQRARGRVRHMINLCIIKLRTGLISDVSLNSQLIKYEGRHIHVRNNTYARSGQTFKMKLADGSYIITN